MINIMMDVHVKKNYEFNMIQLQLFLTYIRSHFRLLKQLRIIPCTFLRSGKSWWTQRRYSQQLLRLLYPIPIAKQTISHVGLARFGLLVSHACDWDDHPPTLILDLIIDESMEP